MPVVVEMIFSCFLHSSGRILWICMILSGHTISSTFGTTRSHDYRERALDRVHGPVCFNCHGSDSPGACTDLTVCKIGEVCMLHELISGTTRSYEASCQSNMMCTMIGQMAASSSIAIGKRAGPLCHVCCSDDFCNNECHAHTQPPTTPSGPVGTRLLCYSCSQQDDPSSCLHHVTCNVGEQCIIRESGVSSSGHKQYQSSCANKNVCDTLLHLRTGPADHSFCYTCCDSDLCNNHCDYHNAMTSSTTVVTSPPTTTTPLAPTKPPTHPTTTPSGPKCWSCSNMSSVADCYHLATCSNGEVCSLQRFSDAAGGNYYEASCQDKKACEQYQQMLQAHFGPGGFCKTCCSVDRCNDICPHVPVPTTHAPTTTTQQSRGLHCYNCDSLADPSRCRQTTMCGKDQVCMLHELIQNGKTSRQFTSSCKSLALCNYIGGLLQDDTLRSGVEHCHECCITDLCNNKCTKGHGVVVTTSHPPTHVPTTHATANTTHGLGSMLMCYSCSGTEDPKFCSHVVPCMPGEVCTVHQVGSHGLLGKPEYMSSCENKQRCIMYRDLAAHGLSSCHTCCESNFCNTQCESHSAATTPAVVTHSTTASPSPLECYSCSLVHDPKGCPTTKTCDPGQVCMLHEKTSTTAGSTSFEASCQEKAVCETLVRVIQSQHSGQGHIFCTYCCNTSRCNNHCEMTSHTTSLPVVNGGWSDWSAWTTCSKTCGSSGIEVRSRTCNNPAPQNHGADCQGVIKQQQQCNDTPCPVDGDWSSWNTWSSCTHTCGNDSERMRIRSCDHPAPSHGGAKCVGQSVEINMCAMPHCPIDGVWSAWNHWNPCSKSCGSGAEIRIRHCNHPSPQYGGHDCPGSSLDTNSCQIKECPVDGEWSHWSAWSHCTETCGSGGQQTRTRTCDHPTPAHGGADCIGSASSHKSCSLHMPACPVDGAWSHWTAWSHCSPSCGSGALKTRARTCDHPAPAHGGANCAGTSTDHQSCTVAACPTPAPLECYKCDLMYSPDGCGNTVFCDAGQVCMLHETSTSVSGTKYYQAKCERNTVCNSVVNILHAQSTGNGHVFCTYCCSHARCNNHCDLAQLTSSRAVTHPLPTYTPLAPSTSQMTPSELCQDANYNYVASVHLCFKIYEVLTSYPGAVDTCEREGGNLAIIHSDVEWQLFAFQLTQEPRIAGMSLYMGGYDVFNNGSYVWSDGNVMTYSHWDQGEPLLSTTKARQMPCVVVDMTDMKWHSDDCQSQRPFICTIRVAGGV